MLKSKKKIIGLLLAAITLVSAIFVATFLSANAAAELKDRYSVGETVEIPVKTLSYNGTEKTADAIVYFPSGAAEKCNRFVVKEAGLYTVEYRAVIQGKLVKETASFIADIPFYSFSGNKSSAKYGKDESQYGVKEDILTVSLGSSERITFEEIIDLKELDGEFFRFYALPKTKGTRDVAGVYIYLTDAYDENNYVKIKMQSVAYNGMPYVYAASYVLAGFNDQSPVGYDQFENRIRRNDRFGTGCYLSLYGNAEEYASVNSGLGIAAGEAFAGFSYDYDENTLYVSHYKGEYKVADFDDPAFFSDEWQGFKTGEVRVSVEGYGNIQPTFNFGVSKLGNADLSSLTIKDEAPPSVTIDTQGYDEANLPVGAKGKGYPVFAATAFDNYEGFVATEVTAYYSTDSDTEVLAEIVDGKVVTDKTGKYRLSYSAQDGFCNRFEKNLYFYVEENAPAIEVSLKDGYARSGYTGNPVKFAEFVAGGGSGRVDVKASVDKKAETDEKASSFIPLTGGKYTVTYTATDFIGTEKKISYEVDVTFGDKPVVTGRIRVPDYLFAGYSVVLSDAKAFDYASGAEVTVYPYVNGEKVSNNGYTVPEKTDGNLIVSYKTDDGKEVYVKSVKVINVKEETEVGGEKISIIRTDNLWVSDNFINDVDENGVSLTVNAFGNARATFAKSLLLTAFSIKTSFKGINADSVIYEFIDADDSNNVLTIKFIKDGYNTAVEVNGKRLSASLSGGFFGEETSLAYSDGKLSDGASLKINLDGLFAAESVNFSIRAENAAAGDKVVVKDVCKQAMDSSVMIDEAAPRMMICGKYSMSAALNETLKIVRARAEDVLDTYAIVKVTVSSPSGTVMKDKNAEVDYEITLNEYGTYRITYVVSDGVNTYKYPYVVEVLNKVPPEIEIKGEIKEFVKVGKEIVFPEATASDDKDGNVKTRYLVLKPDGNTVLLGEDRKFAPDKAGRYKLFITAYDNDGNIAVEERIFFVED